jgi:K+-sensing histidine kinase KdpD
MESNNLHLSAVSTSGEQSAEATLQLLQSLHLSDLNMENRQQSLEAALAIIAERFCAENAYILVKTNGQGELTPLAHISRSPACGSATTFSDTLTKKVMQTRLAVCVKDAMNSTDFPADPAFQRFNVKCAICVPIKTDAKPIGLIYIDSADQHCNWGDGELNLLDFVGGYVGLAWEAAQLRQELADSQRLITAGQVCLNISHSVKNILQLVGGAAEVIDFGLRTNEIHRVKRSWNILKPNLERVKKFTLDMLDFSKERYIELGPCEFNAVIQSAIESLQSQLKQKKTKLHIRVDQKIPLIELDGERIHEMTTNLILNAVDIVDQDTGVVEVETKYLQESSEVQVGVTDNGPGISEEVRGKIFMPFQSTKNKLGTGLGLAIAKRIVEQHKGRIEIDSELGKGTTFRVILPAKIIENSPASAAKPTGKQA